MLHLLLFMVTTSIFLSLRYPDSIMVMLHLKDMNLLNFLKAMVVCKVMASVLGIVFTWTWSSGPWDAKRGYVLPQCYSLTSSPFSPA